VKKELENRWRVEINYHKWIRFFDEHGIGHAEPEAYVVLKDRIILFEVKRTGMPAGRMQMEGLYQPLLEKIFEKPVYSLLICQNVVQDTPHPRFDTRKISSPRAPDLASGTG
jgi:hypothetical protein